jgi:L-ascorbate metabolism protein UlaG (beta-lactamase superfamily)
MMKILAIIIVIIILIFLVIIFLGWIYSAPVYKGPVTDHFDGKKFHNQQGVLSMGFKSLFKWMRTREKGEWKELKDVPFGPPPAEKIEDDSIVVTFINHSTFLVQTQCLNILTDPVCSERAGPVSFAGPKRMRPPGIRFEDVPPINIILLTHNHYDHLDIETLKKLSLKYNPKIFTSLGVGKFLEKNGIGNVSEMDWWDEINIDQGISLICTPAQHFSGRGMFDRDRTLWCGFALQTEKGSIYYSGDSGYGDFFKEIAQKISPVRLSFLPIGAFKPEWFMSSIHASPKDAVRIHQILKSSESIGMHFGTFHLADDGMDEPGETLKSVLKKEGIPETEFIVPEERVSVLIE